MGIYQIATMCPEHLYTSSYSIFIPTLQGRYYHPKFYRSKISRQAIIDLGHHTVWLHSRQEAPVPCTLLGPGARGRGGLVCSGVRLKCKVASCFAFWNGTSQKKRAISLFWMRRQREKLEVKRDLGGKIENTFITFDDDIKLNGIVIALEDLK